MKKTINQLNSEIYQIIQGKDTRILKAVIAKHFPKCKMQMTKLSIEDLEQLVPLVRAAYGGSDS